MTKTIRTGAYSSIIVGAAVAAMAQTPTPQQNTNPSTEQKITVTGCLKAAPPSADSASTAGTSGSGTTGATGTTGTAGAAKPADSPDAKFVLANATVSAAKADTESAATAEAAGTASAAGATQTYRLIANGAALSPHVDKKLELTGTLVDRPASTSATAAGPALKVESGKVIAATCQE